MRYLIIVLLSMITTVTQAGVDRVVDRVVVDKSAHILVLMDGDKVIKHNHVAFGANPKDHKQQEGDERMNL